MRSVTHLLSVRRAAVLVMVLTGALSPVGIAPAQGAQVTYVATTATFANPERGLFRQPDCDEPLDGPWVTSWRTTQNVSLVRCLFSLREFRSGPISVAKLTFLQKQTDVVRAAGLKMVVRFAYTSSKVGDDAPKSVVLGHLDQLTPFFRNNSDVIDVVESGFVGAWGEGAYSQNFGDAGSLTATDWTNRKAVVDKLLTVVPGTRMVLLRTPRMKRTMYGTSPVTSATAYTGSTLSRLGQHNDCFLASSNDKGTYVDPAVEYPYLQADSTYVAVGGETCAPNPTRSDCPTALQELAMFHYSYVNRDYHPDVLQSWRDDGCMNEVEQRLGYRFSLVGALFPNSVARGHTYLAQIHVRNTGYATPHNARPVYLVMRNRATGSTSRVRLSADPRRWAPGAATTIAQNVGVPSTMAPGVYDLLLSLPDPATALAARPEYAIRMANSSVWEPGSGLNRLLATMTVY